MGHFLGANACFQRPGVILRALRVANGLKGDEMQSGLQVTESKGGRNRSIMRGGTGLDCI